MDREIMSFGAKRTTTCVLRWGVKGRDSSAPQAMRPCVLVAPFFVVLRMSAAFVSGPVGMGKHHRGSQVQHYQSQSHHDHDGRYIR